jgi:vacuolar protein sorting-associated protein 29
MLVPNKMQHVLCTGNIGSKTQYNKLNELAPSLHVVAGDMEYNAPLKHSSDTNAGASSNGNHKPFPETKVIAVGSFRIGLIHGHQIIPYGSHDTLSMMRRRLDVDILISGHTHVNEVVEHEGGWHINPGSITGAFSPLNQGPTPVMPSFVLLAVQGPKVVCYVYKLIDGEVDVSKTEFTQKPKPVVHNTPIMTSTNEGNGDSLFDD